MIDFDILDEADQQFSDIMNGRRITLRLRYNVLSNRWSFDLSIDDLPVLYGRRIVLGVDLLAAFDFDIGMLFALPEREGAIPVVEPGRTELPRGIVRLYHATDEDLVAA